MVPFRFGGLAGIFPFLGWSECAFPDFSAWYVSMVAGVFIFLVFSLTRRGVVRTERGCFESRVERNGTGAFEKPWNGTERVGTERVERVWGIPAFTPKYRLWGAGGARIPLRFASAAGKF